MSEEPDKLEENWRNPDGTLKPGHPPMGGRPKGKTLKEYQAEKFRMMSDGEKEEFLKDLSKVERWKMAEGNPHQTSDVEVEVTPTPLLDALRHNNSDKKDSEPLSQN